MRTRPAALVLATAAVAVSLGLTGCSSGEAAAAAAAQEQRNDAVQELSAAQGATLVPVAAEIDQLSRAEQRAVLAMDTARSADVAEQIAAYEALAAAIDAAPTAAAVRAAVAKAGLEVDRTTGSEDVLVG
ncbi:hypothetical protein GCU67_12925 [Modestobacter muralis]|uniref:Uncharacterized protein n=1 Tax=Modestobacter muralis TaxID=1608614 RepID=A0A6P0EX14_9ACTN|nr:hypothetical protein [Modestobacter muralis]NEK95069.1 hypothetical protein [Modestobacter muralis]NEN51957.1 hypothetical protein [Modestobacter muralis]